MPVGPDKKHALARRMTALGLAEADLIERFVLGSGAGGQKINKTASCVYLKHLPSGIEVKCQPSRSRDANRYHARQLLCDRLEARRLGEASREQQAFEMIRRRKRRRSRRQRARMLVAKRQHGEKKRDRAPVTANGE